MTTQSTLLYWSAEMRLGRGWESPIRGSVLFEQLPRSYLADLGKFSAETLSTPSSHVHFAKRLVQKDQPGPQQWHEENTAAYIWGHNHQLDDQHGELMINTKVIWMGN